ncbi:MAG: hypothetical protein BAJATHORv1_120039 [Candidatus Thorarchaeota archaeon]|nr:MAG: hypothetical protein BAJATHORv1_120039 [Candidatus Thorarchaeota archaeon]
MTISEATLKALKEIGLTEYETSAYLALVDHGQMSASDTSTKSQVPYSRIYDVLGRLGEKGFIQTRKGRPTQYRAKSPTEVMRLVRLEWEERLERASKHVVEELQPRFERETPATTRDVWLLHGRHSILAKAIEMLEVSKEEVLLSLPSLDMPTEEISELIERAFSVKAKVMLLTSNLPSDMKNLIPSNFEVRTRSRVFGAGLVIDRRETLIMLAGNEQEEFLGIYASAPVFAAMASAYFDSLWSDSESV